MMMTFEMRPARSEDASQVDAVFYDAWPWATVSLAEEVITEPEHFFVAAEGEQIVAFLNFDEWHNWPVIRGMESHDPDIDDALLVNWIAVVGSRRGQSIGRELMGAWLVQLPDRVKYVILNPAPAAEVDDVAAEHRLRRFYAALGLQLLPDATSEEQSYLLGWSRPGVWLPEPPPWPEPRPELPRQRRVLRRPSTSASSRIGSRAGHECRPWSADRLGRKLRSGVLFRCAEFT